MIEDLMLPKVSVVLVNFNYSAYLQIAFDSIVSQSYPNIEVIIVDDKSTDNSLEIIDGIYGDGQPVDGRSIVVVKSTENGGQSVASRRGFAASSGAYVVFLDADDQLLANCVEAHVYAHLSSRIPIAFSSVDVFNHMRGSDVNASHEGFSSYVQSGKGRRINAVRDIAKSAPNSWFGGRVPVVSADQIHFVLPPYTDPWVWSPASANCFRRDAVAMFFKDAPLERIRWGTDLYLMRSLSGLFGSIIIDKPLLRYVIHGGNSFAKGAPLNKYLIFDPSATTQHMRSIARLSIDFLLDHAEEISLRYTDHYAFFLAVRSIGDGWPGPDIYEGPSGYFFAKLKERRVELEAIFGRQLVADVRASRMAPARITALAKMRLLETARVLGRLKSKWTETVSTL